MTEPVLASRHVRLELVLAIVGKAAAAFGTIGLASLSPFVRDEFGLSTFGVGGIMGLIFVGALLSTVPGGRLTDRVPAGRVLGACLLLEAAALGLVAVAPSALVFFLGVGLVGLCMGGGDPATNVLVSTNVPRWRRGLLMGVKQTGLTFGGIVGGLALPSIAEAASWRVAVVAPIAACAAVGFLGLWVAGAVRQRPEVRSTEPVRSAPLLGMGVYGFFMAGIQLSVLGLLAVFLVDQAELSATAAGVAVSVALAGGTLGRIIWGFISDLLLHSRLLTLELAALGAAIALVVLSFSVPTAALWPLLFVLGFCAIGWNTVYITVAAESVPPSRVGRATGTALFFSYAGGLLIPPLLGIVVDGTDSWLVAWLVAAAVAAAGLVALTVVSRRALAVT